MIKVQNLKFKYPNSKNFVIENSTFEIHEGEITAIVGENGSGKTTFGYLLSGLLELNNKDYGNIEIDGYINIVFQNPEIQIIANNVFDEISFVLKNFKIKEEEIEKRIKDALLLVGMEDKINDNPLNFSLGQKQKIAIASVLALKPKYIVFDESTSFLDSKSKDQILSIYKELKKLGFGVIVITNVIDELLIADKLLYFTKDNRLNSFEGSVIDNIEKVSKILEKINFKLTPLWKLHLLASTGDEQANSILKKVY